MNTGFVPRARWRSPGALLPSPSGLRAGRRPQADQNRAPGQRSEPGEEWSCPGNASADLADAVADEADQLQALGLEQVADRLGVVLDERLFGQDVLGEPRPQLALGDLLDDVGRLAGGRRLRLGDLPLLLDHRRVDVLA